MTQQGEDCTHMENASLPQAALAHRASPASVFALPEILPANTRLLLDPEAHTVSLLTQEGVEAAPMLRSFSLTPSTTRLFLSLLQTYPLHCSHRALFLSLYPDTEKQREREWWTHDKDLALPLVRRALRSLLPAFRACGLRAVSLRGQGYVLASASTSNEHATEPSIRAPCLSQNAARSLAGE